MEVEKSMRRQAEVALSMTKQLFDYEEKNKNMVFSPFSVHAVVSVMAAGSDGRTLEELLSFLRFDSTEHLNTLYSHIFSALFSDSLHLSFANGMWAHDSLSLSHSFKQLVATHYKATLASVDFQAKGGDQVRREVNRWVEKETNGLIIELLPPQPVQEGIRFFFANALHFKGAWERKFDASRTFFHNFHLLNGTSVEVPFMKSQEDEDEDEEEQFITAFDGFKVLRLPYKQARDQKHQFSMYIFLPNAKDGLSALIQNLVSEPGFLEKTFPRRKVQVSDFMIPRFKISSRVKAADLLKELGVVSPFSQDADFTKMVEGNDIYVDNIFHNAFIEVNEKGTKAAAATAMSGRERCDSDTTGIDFVADHPFLFLIREDFTKTILFIGQVLNPLDGADRPLRPDNRLFCKKLSLKTRQRSRT